MSDELLSALVMLSPLALVIAAFWPASRGHWAAIVLATPALLMGLAWVAALFKKGAGGPGVLGVLLYAPVLLALGSGVIVRWYRRHDRAT